MKRITSSLLVLVLSSAALTSVAKADPTSANQASAFEVTTLAYQGRLADNGIPGYGSLEVGVQSGNIVAEDVVRAAIDAGRLTATALDNEEFVTAVDHQLHNLANTK